MPTYVRTFSIVVIATLLCSGSLAFARVGPPWIAIELPANPLDPSTRGALVLVRTYHHDVLVPRTLTCAFEGIVDGDRLSASCRVEDTRWPGVYAIRGDLPEGGVWMLVVSGGERQEFGTALVEFTGAGEVSGVRVPSRRDGRWRVPTPVSDHDVTSMLRARWNALSHADDGHFMKLAGFGVLALIPMAGLLAARRRRRGMLSRTQQ